MTLSLKKQQHHIKQLLSTAAAGTGVVGDVDALLTPIGMSTMTTLRTEPKAERNLWREEEMLQMLHLMLKANAIEMLNDKSVKSEKVFRNIEKLMFDSGFQKKSYNQIWTKWKFLKSTYMTSRRAGVVPKMIPSSIYKVLDTILRDASSVSVCGGNSNGAGGSSLDGYNSDGGRLIISHVESGGLANGFAGSNKNEAGESNKETEDDSYGMAHPIFGFRLGIVKPEPIDTGYETPPVVNGIISDNDPLDNKKANSLASTPPNTDNQPEIKQEADEIEENNSLQKPLEALTETEASAASTPVQQSSTSIVPLSQRNSQMPPLRIAPFAKASQFNIQRQQQPCRSPPPLSMHPVTQHQQQQQQSRQQQHLQSQHLQQQQQQQTHRHFTRHSQGHTPGSSTISINNNSSNVRIQRMVLSKPVHQQHQHRVISTSTTGTQIRLPREITIHTTPRLPVNVTIPRLKQLAKRPPYEGQHIESVLPDMDSDIILRQQKQQQLAMSFEPPMEEPCTSQQAKLKNRKRRLKLPPIDAKCAKTLKTYSNAKQERTYQDSDCYSNLRCRLSGKGMDTVNQGDTPSRLETQSIKQNQEKINLEQKQKHFEQQQKKNQKKKDEDYFDEALKDLGKSLRNVQRQVIHEFFEKQMEMARKEHEFQAQQDKLLMEAFEEQTQMIMRSAKTLLGIDLPGLKTQKQSEEKPKTEEKTLRRNDEKQKDDDKKVNAEYEKHQEQEEEEEEEDEEEESMEPYYQQGDEGDNDDGDAEDDDENGNDEDEEDGDEEDDEEEEDEGGEQDDQHEEYPNENNDESDEPDENEFEDPDYLDPCADPIELVSSELVEDTT